MWAASGVVGACPAVLLAAFAVAAGAAPPKDGTPAAPLGYSDGDGRSEAVAQPARAGARRRSGVAALQIALRGRGFYAATVDGVRECGEQDHTWRRPPSSSPGHGRDLCV